MVECVTTAFWDQDGCLTGADSWETILQHGAALIAEDVMPSPDLALQ